MSKLEFYNGDVLKCPRLRRVRKNKRFPFSEKRFLKSLTAMGWDSSRVFLYCGRVSFLWNYIMNDSQNVGLLIFCMINFTIWVENNILLLKLFKSNDMNILRSDIHYG